MTLAIQFCLTGLCLVVYLPVIVNAVQQISRGEVILHGRSLFRNTSRRYTGTSVWAYAGGQALSALILITGGLSAVQRDDLGFLFLTLIVSLLVGVAGLQLADRIGYEELADPHEEAISLLRQILSSATGIGRHDATDNDSGDKDRPIIISLDNNVPEDPHPLHDKDAGEGDDDV